MQGVGGRPPAVADGGLGKVQPLEDHKRLGLGVSVSVCVCTVSVWPFCRRNKLHPVMPVLVQHDDEWGAIKLHVFMGNVASRSA